MKAIGCAPMIHKLLFCKNMHAIHEFLFKHTFHLVVAIYMLPFFLQLHISKLIANALKILHLKYKVLFTTCSFPKLKLLTKPLTTNYYVHFIQYFLGNSYKRFILMNIVVSKNMRTMWLCAKVNYSRLCWYVIHGLWIWFVYQLNLRFALLHPTSEKM